MSKARGFVTVFCILILAQGLRAQDSGRSNRENRMDAEGAEMIKQILLDKFDTILPQIMREHEIDMWIQVMREGGPNPMGDVLGGNNGVFIFTDRGGDRIERAVIGHRWNSSRGSRGAPFVDIVWENIILNCWSWLKKQKAFTGLPESDPARPVPGQSMPSKEKTSSVTIYATMAMA